MARKPKAVTLAPADWRLEDVPRQMRVLAYLLALPATGRTVRHLHTRARTSAKALHGIAASVDAFIVALSARGV